MHASYFLHLQSTTLNPNNSATRRLALLPRKSKKCLRRHLLSLQHVRQSLSPTPRTFQMKNLEIKPLDIDMDQLSNGTTNDLKPFCSCFFSLTSITNCCSQRKWQGTNWDKNWESKRSLQDGGGKIGKMRLMSGICGQRLRECCALTTRGVNATVLVPGSFTG